MSFLANTSYRVPIIESVFTTLSGVTGKCSLPVSSPISKTQHDGINKLQLALKSNYTLAELLQYIIVLSFMADSPVGTGVTLMCLIEVNSIAQHLLMSSRQLS